MDKYATDDEDDLDTTERALDISGRVQKWTNYISGWQERYVVLRNGTLTYYKSENDTTYGCRGALSITKATIKPHEFDECRFDVSLHDCVWYLRAESAEDRQKWMDLLETYKTESGYGSESNLRRHGSTMSLTSGTLSTASTSSFKKARSLKEKVAEMETFRDILCRQVDTLQSYFDACADSVAVIGSKAEIRGTSDSSEEDPEIESTLNRKLRLERRLINHMAKDTKEINKDLLLQHGAHAIDFKGEAITFKATTAGILSTLSHCIELMNQREEQWKRRLDRESEKRHRAEDHARMTLAKQQQIKICSMIGSPDFEEGPHSTLNEDEFYDAVDAQLDRIESEEEKRRNRLVCSEGKQWPISATVSAQSHPLWPEIDRITLEQFNYARMGVGEGGWNMFAEDGEMKMFKREVEEAGLIVDPLKAIHCVKGFTGREMCYYFFNPDVRLDWEITLESTKVLEVVSDDVLLFHQVHKTIWPTTQRDAVFWSHMRRIPNADDKEGNDTWIVCNQSTDRDDIPKGKCIRLFLTVCLVCQTVVNPPANNKPITRDDITCKIAYCATVNPGGWAPVSVLRAVYKREYPRFLKRFTEYVQLQTAKKPIMF